MKNAISEKLIIHGKILGRPLRQPQNTEHSVAYKLGKCFQLDKKHCLLVASMNKQGGGDMCEGNHGIIFQKLNDISGENAIEIN